MGDTSCGAGGASVGDKCTPVCNDGYEAAGTYDCADGGFTSQGACIKPGQTVVKVYYVKSVITLGLTIPDDMTVESLADNADFKASVKDSLAESLGDDVNAEDIEILGIS